MDDRRTDIQALRGIAVLLVVAYHADFGVLRAGYLGVDIFFVISGYLITGLICRDLDADRFSFVDFYRRRARRLLPASLTTFALTSIAACFLLTAIELRSYTEQVLGAVTFTANFVFASQSNYFDTSASLKPLLHTWSLSVEEQFYFVVPFILWITPARFRLHLICAFLVASLAACFVLVRFNPNWTFYMLPTRSWELSIGSLIAVLPSLRIPRLAGTVALGAIVAISVRPVGHLHPGIDALIVCLAAAALIVARPALLNSGLIARALAWVGGISYSLYLVHWPVFAFTRHIYLGELPLAPALFGVALSFALAVALYHWVERPIHRGETRLPRPLTVGALSAVMVVAAPIGYAAATRGDIDWTEVRKPNVGLATYCDMVPPVKSCMTRADPEIAVWGDSFAMHLVDGLVALDKGHGIVQLTRSACAPVISGRPDDDAAMESCVKFNRAALAYIEQSDVKYVVLSAAGRYDRLEPALRELQAAGKSVVLVGPPPESKTDKSICVERRSAGIKDSDCAITQNDLVDVYAPHIRLVKDLERKGFRVIWLAPSLCTGQICSTHDKGVPLYRDTSHLSVYGSVEVAKRLDLISQILGR